MPERWNAPAACRGWNGQYFANRDVHGGVVADALRQQIDFDFGTGGPGLAGIGTDDFGVRWTREVTTATDHAFSGPQ